MQERGGERRALDTSCNIGRGDDHGASRVVAPDREYGGAC
jgi:hypothetical protein